MFEQPYKRPPITEAVVEIRFSAELNASELEKISHDYSAVYPNRETLRNVLAELNVPPNLQDAPTTQINQHIGYRLASTDLTELLVLWPASFVVSQLAPYPGWNAFFSRFDRDWIRWKKALGYRKIVRVGVRYINRVDIPVQPGCSVEESEYMNVYPQYPEMIGNVTGYLVQFKAPMKATGCNLIMNSGSVPSPLLDHLSIMLDLDIHRESDCPQNDENIYALLNQIRRTIYSKLLSQIELGSSSKNDRTSAGPSRKHVTAASATS